jgi:hypothetical protein
MKPFAIVIGALLLPLWTTSARAQTSQARVEERVFRIKIEDREAGRYSQKITTYPDGTTDLDSRGDVKLSVLGITFQYAYRGNERWKDNRLLYLASASNENNKTHQLMVTSEGDRLKVKEGGKERLLAGDAWSTSYWTLPPADRRLRPVLLVDSDSGEEHRVQLQVVGKQNLQVGTRAVACTHYRVTGTLQVDLWFDEKDRLVRREMTRKSRRTVVELLSVSVH